MTSNRRGSFSVHPPPVASSSQIPSFRQGSASQAPALLQHWYTPNTLLLPGPLHSAASPTLTGCPLSFSSSRQPMKLRRFPRPSGAEAKSKASWERISRHGSVSVVDAGCCWSRVSLRAVELTSIRTLCHWPFDTGSDLTSRDPGGAFPQLYLSCSAPLMTCGRKMKTWLRRLTSLSF